MKTFQQFQEDAAPNRGALTATTSGDSSGFQASQRAGAKRFVDAGGELVGKAGKAGAKLTAKTVKGIAKGAGAVAKGAGEKVKSAGQRVADKIKERPAKKEIPVAKKPEATKPEVKRPEVRKPEVKRPEVKRPEVRRPEVRRPEVKRPEAKRPAPERPALPAAKKPAASAIKKVAVRDVTDKKPNAQKALPPAKKPEAQKALPPARNEAYDPGEAKQRLQKRRRDAVKSQQQSIQDTKWNKRKEEIKNELRKEIETGA